MADVAVFAVASLLYLGATGSYHVAWLGEKRRYRRAATRLLLAAVVVHGLGLAMRWLQAGRPPLANAFEGLSFYGWMLAAGYLVLERWTRHPGLGALVVPIALVAVAVAAFLPKGIEPLEPVLQSPWLGVHAGVSFLAYVTFTLAFGTALAFLRQDRILKRRRGLGWGRDLPSLLALEMLGRRLALAGFVLMTGSLVSGSIWARTAWGVPWVWQPQQVAALVTWGVYAGYLLAWYGLGWRGRRVAWLLVAGFVAVIITFVGVDLALPGGLHDFMLQ